MLRKVLAIFIAVGLVYGFDPADAAQFMTDNSSQMPIISLEVTQWKLPGQNGVRQPRPIIGTLPGLGIDLVDNSPFKPKGTPLVTQRPVNPVVVGDGWMDRLGPTHPSSLLIKAHQNAAKVCRSAFGAVIQVRNNEVFTDKDVQDIDQYDQACLFRLDQTTWWSKLLGNLGVLIEAKTGNVTCTGWLVRDRIVQTARHCLFDLQASVYRRRAPSELAFALLGSPTVARPIDRFIDSPESTPTQNQFSETMQRSDYAALRLAVPVEGFRNEADISTELVRADTIGQVIIPGWYGLNAYHGKTPFKPKPVANGVASADWPRFLRYDAAPTCRIMPVSDGTCYAHSCQADEGMSGSPIFILDATQSRITLVGVHTAAMRSDRPLSAKAAKPECDDQFGEITRNVGVVLTQKKLTILLSQVP